MDFVQLPNGEMANVWSYGTPNDNSSDFEEVPFKFAEEKLTSYMRAAHGLIYCKCDELLWDKYPVHALILMQMRSDGNLGFGGGLLDKHHSEEVVSCLNREYEEEFNLDLKKCSFSQSDHVMTHVNHKKKLVLHMYAHEIDRESFVEFEKGASGAKDWGTETLGVVRVPLFVVDFDNTRGFPVFLANQFAGCAKEQLIETLKRRDIVPGKELQFALECHRKYVESRS